MRAVILIFDNAAERREFFSHDGVAKAFDESNIEASRQVVSVKVANAAIRAQSAKRRAKRKAADKRLAKLRATQKANRAELRDSGPVWTYTKVYDALLHIIPPISPTSTAALLNGTTLGVLGVNHTELRSALLETFDMDCLVFASPDTTFGELVEWVHKGLRDRTT